MRIQNSRVENNNDVRISSQNYNSQISGGVLHSSNIQLTNQRETANFLNTDQINQNNVLSDTSSDVIYQKTGLNASQILCMILAFGVLIAIIIDYKQFVYLYNKMVEWIVQNPELAACVLILLYIVSITMFVPISQYHLMIGFTYSQIMQSPVYGFIVGAPIAFTGSILGAALSFLLSRYFLQNQVKEYVQKNKSKYPWLQNFEIINIIFESGQQSIRIIALLRLVMIPFGLTNYMLGVTSVSFINYITGSCSYIFKSSLHTFIGCTLYSVTSTKGKQNGLENIVFISELLFTCLLTLVISFYAKTILDEKIKEMKDQNQLQRSRITDNDVRDQELR